MKKTGIVQTALFFVLSILYVHTAYAASDDGQRMLVQLNNETDSICQLRYQYLYYGKYDSPIPESILPHDSRGFIIEQVSSLWSPDITLKYTCDTNAILFDVQQTASIMIGHTPSVSVSEAHGLAIDADIRWSSVWYNYTAITNITIKPTT